MRWRMVPESTRPPIAAIGDRQAAPLMEAWSGYCASTPVEAGDVVVPIGKRA